MKIAIIIAISLAICMSVFINQIISFFSSICLASILNKMLSQVYLFP